MKKAKKGRAAPESAGEDLAPEGAVGLPYDPDELTLPASFVGVVIASKAGASVEAGDWALALRAYALWASLAAGISYPDAGRLAAALGEDEQDVWDAVTLLHDHGMLNGADLKNLYGEA